MATCPNCKKSLSCGCQLRKAKDGTNVCTNCLPNYNGKITKPAPSPVAPPPAEWGWNKNK